MDLRRLLIVIGLLFASLYSTAQSSDLSTQIGRIVSIHYQTYDYAIAPISFSAEKLPKTLTRNLTKDCVFTITIAHKLSGYAYWGQSASKDHLFDFLIFLTPELKIIKLKILVYREQFGREITDQRWLKQFEGMSPESTITFGKTVDAISGATISSRSMTYTVKQVLKSMQILKKHHLL